MPYPYGVTIERNIYPAKVESFQSEVAMENGTVVQRGALVANEKDVLTAVQPTTATLGKKLYFVSHPIETPYSHIGMMGNPESYTIPAGKAYRAYALVPDNEWGITQYTIDGGDDIAVGNFIVAQNGSNRLIAVPNTTDVSTYGFVGVIERFEISGLPLPGNSFSPVTIGGIDPSAFNGIYNFVIFRVIKNIDIIPASA